MVVQCGHKQGAAPLLDLGLGAHIGGVFLGIVVYADDVLLIAPTRNAMQRMLSEVEVFAEDSNIVFSTDPTPQKSKTKCILCHREIKRSDTATTTSSLQKRAAVCQSC